MNTETKTSKNEEFLEHEKHAKTADGYDENAETCIFCAALDNPDGMEAAYISLVGDEYATIEDANEAYSGHYTSDEDFAQEMAEETGAIPKDGPGTGWPMYAIDWEMAAKDLMMDYMEENGYYFRNL